VIRICIILIYPLPTVATYSLLVLVTIMPVFFGLSWFVTGQEGHFQLVTARMGACTGIFGRSMSSLRSRS
jgi:hypothetical protein